ncbi:hypothetical protein CspeluHIS016_0101030 [Cutaneotrichosporon spelunceum]|uniref:RNA polymerase I-specific transcription initiation factor RRN3 n=1 Tax=Cutaneotrichosporon spelunceum TaxID=1672016 RepID=A0AAD3TN75_9TREE|nr:hypothetical protein CspeluHIS016_0101030 [Cutaneotrichosporon spelunceum]
MSRDVIAPRATSMQGKRRRIDTEAPEKSRRTQSVGGDSRDLRSSSLDRLEAKEREAFQRQLIGVFVPRALKESVEGNTHNYSDLLSHFLPPPGASTPQLPPLLPLLRALTAHVSLIDSGVHHALVGAILNLPWATADDRFVKCYIGFCGVLVSAHPGWARDIVTMAVRGLTWQPPQSSSSNTPITRRAFHARHHLLISHMLALIPTLPNLLQPILNRSAPNKREPEVVQTTWVRNCCELIEYCPELGARVWSSLVDRMLRIDVEITNRADDDDEDDDDDEGGVRDRGDPFDLMIDQNIAGDDEDSDDESDDGEDLDPDEISSEEERDSDDEEHTAEHRKKRREMLRSMRQKLDGMLVHFLTHLQESMRGGRQVGAAELAARDISAVSSETPSASATPLPQTPATPTGITGMARTPPTPAQSLAHFQTLLNLFCRQILPTSATQHLPFTLFLCSSFSPAHADLFLHRLVSLALYASDTPTPTPTQPVPLTHRTAAAVYIGSLVTRARFVSDEQTRTVLQYLLAYVDGKLAQTQTKNRRVASDELPLFYAVCQAAMLIFCFRWRALTADDEVAGELEMDIPSGREWMRDLDVLQRALTSELNPLLGCNPSVVNMFAKVAHTTGFAYCFSIIEANTHVHTKRSAPSIAAPRAARQANIDAGLDSYFPFDPFDLARSGEFVEALYRTWDEVAVDVGGDTDTDDSDDEAEESDESLSAVELGPGRIPVATNTGKRPLPMARGGSSFGEHRRRNILHDGGLSTSLEHMSISPVPSGLLGGA